MNIWFVEILTAVEVAEKRIGDDEAEAQPQPGPLHDLQQFELQQVLDKVLLLS